MKLSLRKRIGWTQVRGGRVMRVAATHGVATDTLSVAEEEEIRAGTRAPRWPDGEPAAVFAQPGDLALEILHKHGALVGYTYLSGDAIQLNCYDAMPFWFEPAAGSRFEIPATQPGGETEAFWNGVIETVMGVKYSDSDLAVFTYTCNQHETAKEVVQGIFHIYQYAPADMPAADRKTHILGHIHGSKKEGVVSLHIQPPQDAGDFMATPFQIELALSAMR